MGAEVEAEVRTACHKDNLDSASIIAEIPGGSEPDEVVMLEGHRDSTAAAWGATDNRSGCAVTTQSVRISKVGGRPTDRTVGIALWDGEGRACFAPKPM